MNQKVSRETLYDEVWVDPVTEVAKRYGLSDVGLAKLCRTMGIPLPARGYWAKLRTGAKSGRTPLPTDGRYRQAASLTRFGPDAVKESEEAKRRVRETRQQVMGVSISPIDRHPLVVEAAKRLAKGDVKSEKGLVSAPAEVLHVEEHYTRIMEQRKRERGLFEDLEAKAKKWKRAQHLRAYVDAVEQAVALKGELTDELLDWISWARAKADWLDPMICVSDPILDAPEPEKPYYWW